MTRDDIVRMAREVAGVTYPDGTTGVKIGMSEEHLERFANLIAAAEREACIELLEDFSKTKMVPVVDTWRMGLIAGANAIRQRGRNEQR
jgi:hypothetical protein